MTATVGPHGEGAIENARWRPVADRLVARGGPLTRSRSLRTRRERDEEKQRSRFGLAGIEWGESQGADAGETASLLAFRLPVA